MLKSRGCTSIAITVYPNTSVQQFKTDNFWHAIFLDCDQMLFTNTKKKKKKLFLGENNNHGDAWAHTYILHSTSITNNLENCFQRRAKAQKCNSFYILQIQKIQAFQNTRLLFMPIDIHITEFQLQKM